MKYTEQVFGFLSHVSLYVLGGFDYCSSVWFTRCPLYSFLFGWFVFYCFLCFRWPAVKVSATNSLLLNLIEVLTCESNNKLASMEGPQASAGNRLFEGFIKYPTAFSLFVYFWGLHFLKIKLLKV